MMFKHKLNRPFLLLITIISIVATTASAQPNPIKWRCLARMTSATEGVVTVRALIAEGWHLYGLVMPEGGPKATVISLDSSKDVKFTSKLVPSQVPLVKRDAIFDMDVNFWEQKVEFSCKFKVTGPEPRITGTVTYMGCNDETCSPPATISITAPITPIKK